MLNFLKKILKGEEKPIEEEVKIEDLSAWVEEKTKPICQENDEIVESLKREAIELIARLEEPLQDLLNAELKNDKIPLKEIQIMEGHRNAYIQKVKQFINGFNEMRGTNPEEFLRVLDEKFSYMAKQTYKSFFVLQEFFGNETKLMAKKIKEVEEAKKKLKEQLEDPKIKKIKEIRKKTRELYEKREKKNRLEEIKKQKEHEKKELTEKRKELEKELESLRKGKEYKELERLRMESKKTEDELKAVERKIHADFAVIEHALKKYQRMALEQEIIDDYLKNPKKALITDTEFKIVSCLKKLAELVKDGKIEMKDRRKDKTLETIGKMTRDYLNGIALELSRLQYELSEKNKLIKNIKSQIPEDDILYRIENTNSRLKSTEKEISSLTRELNQINIESGLEKLKQKINETLRVELTISIS